MVSEDALLLDELTPLGFRVRCSVGYWERIVSIKHPAMRDRLDDVRMTLSQPDEIRRSLRDPDVLLFHRVVSPRWVCGVVKKSDQAGYLITAYPADKIKRGDVIWTK
ncbi:MAG: DUF4258 domain-containing protein [Acidobacteriota bacterium]